MHHLEGYIRYGDEGKVYFFKKTLYGLKQSPRQWYKRFDDYILKDALSVEFEIKNLGVAKKILGMDIVRNKSKNKMFLSHKAYLEKILHMFNMFKSRAIGTPLG